MISDLCREFQLDDDYFDEIAGEADTVAGLLLEIKGDFPHKKEILSFGNFNFEVLKIEERRISKIRISRTEISSQQMSKSQ